MPYADPLTDAELAEALAGLPEWSRDGDVIRLAPGGPDKLGEVRTGRLVLEDVGDETSD